MSWRGQATPKTARFDLSGTFSTASLDGNAIGGTKIMGEYSIRALKLAILEMLAPVPKAHKINLIGRVYQQGDLEHRLKVTFEAPDRQLADRAFEQLKVDGEIRSTYDDVIDPESWVQITDAGREALKRRCLDELDLALRAN